METLMNISVQITVGGKDWKGGNDQRNRRISKKWYEKGQSNSFKKSGQPSLQWYER